MAKKRTWLNRIRRPALLFLGAYLAGCWMLSGLYLSPHRSTSTPPRGFSDTIVAGSPAWVSDSLTSTRQASTVVIFAHGYGGDRGHFSDLMQRLEKEGIASVSLAMPGQDASPIANVGFGPAEAKVIANAVEWVHAKGARKIVVAGVSMGGAATWLATEQTPHIDAIVTEGAYARFDRAMDDWLDSALPGGRLLLRPMVWMASARSGVDPSSIRPIESARKWKKPGLVIQADDDRLIHRAHASDLSQASGAELWCVPDAKHANCYAADPIGYEDRFVKFVKAAIEMSVSPKLTKAERQQIAN